MKLLCWSVWCIKGKELLQYLRVRWRLMERGTATVVRGLTAGTRAVRFRRSVLVTACIPLAPQAAATHDTQQRHTQHCDTPAPATSYFCNSFKARKKGNPIKLYYFALYWHMKCWCWGDMGLRCNVWCKTTTHYFNKGSKTKSCGIARQCSI